MTRGHARSEAAGACAAPREMMACLSEARAQTDALFALVRPGALTERPIPERHRLIFYLGHLEAFDRNLLGEERPRVSLDRLFAFGIDPTSGDLPDDRPSDWPRQAAILDYGRRAREEVDRVVAAGAAAETLLHVAIEHRLMHAETLACALNQMPLDSLVSMPFDPPRSAPRAEPGTVAIPEGVATLGRPREGGGFGWDNEYEQLVVPVPAFAIDRGDVTNRRYLEFIAAGGYGDRSLWSEEAWTWLRQEGIAHPHLWRRRGDAWWYRAMFAEIPLPLDWPVYVSHAEATAFAIWSGRSLPTEAQFHRAAYGAPGGSETPHPWGAAPPRAGHGNFGMRRWDPVPAAAHPAGDSAFGVHDLVGNGWEWTSTPFEPFPGFEPFAFYPGYSADFFPREGLNGTHYVLKGAAARTAGRLLRRSFRNWFQPLYPYLHATFRCVET